MNWKDRKKYPTAKDPVLSTRVPARIQDAMRRLANDNNTTVTAVTTAALDEFLERNDPEFVPDKGALFD